MTNPTTVIVANEFVANTKIEDLQPGQVTVVGPEKEAVTVANTENLKTIFIAAKKRNGQVVFSPAIHKDQIDIIEGASYIAPIEESAIVDFSNGAVITGGREYVLRLVYKDIYDHPGQFTQTYRAVLGENSTAETLTLKFLHEISRKDTYSPIDKSTSRVTAVPVYNGVAFDYVVDKEADLAAIVGPTNSQTAYAFDTKKQYTYSTAGTTWVAGAVVAVNGIKLTAKKRTDAGDLYSINEYAQVNFEVATWNVVRDGYMNSYESYDAKITYVDYANPGKGQWRLVRDREKFGAAYKGNLNAKAWPATNNSTLWYDLNTVVDANYNTLTLITDQPYISVQAQYEEKAKYQTEVYLPSGFTGLSDLLDVFSQTGFLKGVLGKVKNTTGTANDQTVVTGDNLTALA